jgi:hypothetical protein
MMNPSEFLEYINAGTKIPDASVIPGLENLLRKYPSSSILHMLYAKMFPLQDKQGKEASVQLAALYCSERKRLHDYLNDIPSEVFARHHIPEYKFELEEADAAANSVAGNDLISKFLNEKPIFQMKRDAGTEEEEPRIEPEIISEAMAEIYIRQGLTGKAISTFEKLSLKYPEKNTYFAARIKKIKN